MGISVIMGDMMQCPWCIDNFLLPSYLIQKAKRSKHVFSLGNSVEHTTEHVDTDGLLLRDVHIVDSITAAVHDYHR